MFIKTMESKLAAASVKTVVLTNNDKNKDKQQTHVQ